MAEEEKSGEAQKNEPPEVKEAKLPESSQGESLKQNLAGTFIIARSEAVSHLKSPRMAVLMLIFIMAVMSGAYVFAGMASNYDPEPLPEYLAWTFFVNYDNDELSDDILFITTDLDGRPVENVVITIYNKNGTQLQELVTDNNGRAIFNDYILYSYASCKKGDYEIAYHPIIVSNTQLYQMSEDGLPIYTQAQATNLDDDNVRDDVVVLVLNSTLDPVANARIEVNGKEMDRPLTNGYGVSQEWNLIKDVYEFDINWNGETSIEEVQILNDDMDIENLLKLHGPDEVLMNIAGIFMVMIVPIIAIGIAFDSISREKVSKSIVFLLCRPVGKRSIAVGKFLGSLIALVIPLTLISLISIGIISSVTDKSPSGSFVAGFLFATIVFMAIFILLQQVFSTLARTTGNAILAGIGIWLFFYIFFGLIVLAVNQMLGNQFNSDPYFQIANQMSLLSPIGIYGLIINAISPTSDLSATGIPEWAPFVSSFIWFVVLFVIAIELFRKRPYL